MKQKTVFILLLCASLAFSGCAGAKIKNIPAKDNAQIKNVYATIRQMLEHGDIICVRVHYKSSYEGLLSDEKPEDYGCEADPQAIVETEKYLLLEAFSKFPNFSISDRTMINSTYNEIKMSMNGASSSGVQAGHIKGATHMLVIDARNRFVTLGDKVTDHFFETKKFVDLQKSTLLAMDKFSESRVVEYITEEHGDKEEDQDTHHPVLISGPWYTGGSAQQGKGDVNVPYAPAVQSNLKNNEVISITGTRPEPASHSVSAAEQTGQPVYQFTHVTYQNTHDPRFSGRKLPAWPIARVLKQNHPEIKGQNDKYVVQDFLANHPGFVRHMIQNAPSGTPPDNR
jgi:hypothetical protein